MFSLVFFSLHLFLCITNTQVTTYYMLLWDEGVAGMQFCHINSVDEELLSHSKR